MSTSEHKPGPNCDSPAAGLLSVDEAKQRILDLAPAIDGRERVAVRDALNRVLAEDICSTLDVPPFDNSAMDGYALRSEDLSADGPTTLHCVGTALAGTPYAGDVAAGQCVRIMTGAVLPAGADVVVMQEQVKADGDRVEVGGGHRAGENVRRAGEDMRAGAVVLARGKQILPAELGLLASLGIAEVYVYRPLRVAFFSTGDELRGVGETLREGEIYDSNRYTLYGMLRRLGVTLIDMGVIRDRREEVRAAFRTAADIADAVITSGGVSVGAADYVKQTLDELGQVNFWRVAMKPGKPMAVGSLGKAFFFGLPGNPVSAMATFYQFVRPALLRMMGATSPAPLTLRATLQSPLKKSPGRLEYQRGIAQQDAAGALTVTSTGRQGSHVLTSMSAANCFVILPAASGDVEAGAQVEIQLFAGLI